jgi:hypothetical protein
LATRFKGVLDGEKEPLCRTCQYAHYIKGNSISEIILECSARYEPSTMPFEAVECSKYEDKRKPDRHTYEKIAWHINTDRKTGTIGFLSPAEWKKLSKENRTQGPIPEDDE